MIYVVCWQYGDQSGHGIIGYAVNKSEAEFVLNLLKEHGSGKEFYMVEIQQVVPK